MQRVAGGLAVGFLGLSLTGTLFADNATLKPEEEDAAIQALADDPETALKLGELVKERQQREAERQRREAEEAQKAGKILAEWERKSVGRTEVDAEFQRIVMNRGPFRDRTEYQGRIWLKAPAFLCQELRKRETDGAKKWAFFQRIVTDGREIKFFDGEIRRVDVFHRVEVNEEKLPATASLFPNGLNWFARGWVFALDPNIGLERYGLPAFLRPIQAETIQKRFRVTLEAETESTARLLLEPREPDGREFIGEIRLNLDKTTYFPSAIQFVDSNIKITQTYRIGSLKTVVSLDPEATLRQAPPQGWAVVDFPLPERPEATRPPVEELPTPRPEAVSAPR